MATAHMIAPGAAGQRRLTLGSGEAHVWVADLDELGDGWLDLLSSDEHRRCQAMVSEQARRRWGRGRGLLRGILGAYLGREPSGLDLDVGAHGKPRLAGPRPGDPSFNLAHSGALALYGIAAGGAVGIDVQQPREGIDELALAARALGAELTESLGALEPAERHGAFMRAWTRHEAMLKWRGTGIGAPAPEDAGVPWTTQVELGGDVAAALVLDREPAALLIRAVGGDPPLRSASVGSSPLAQLPGGVTRGS